MESEEQIIHLCQAISSWVSKRGEAAVRREKGVFEQADKQVKKWVKDLKNRIKNETV